MFRLHALHPNLHAAICRDPHCGVRPYRLVGDGVHRAVRRRAGPAPLLPAPAVWQRRQAAAEAHQVLAAKPHLDVGAHDGSDALSYAVHNHSVLSFEPAHSKAQRIRALLAKDRRGRQVTFYEAAVGAHAGNASFYTTGGETDSLADDAVGAPPAWAKNATRATQKQTVRVVSLDEVVGGGRSVAFLKVDAQGHDAAVLRGAARLLVQRRALVVLFEVRHVHVYTAYCGAWH